MDRLLRWTKDFIRELRRRRVIRVAVVYAGTGFVILQLGEVLVEPFGLPGWTLRMVTFLLILGFPLAVGLAWVFDVTEEGLVRTESEGDDVRELGPGGKPFTSDAVIIGLLVLIAGLLLYPRLTGPAGEPPSEKVQGGPPAPQDTATARLGPRSVAVLPFTYLVAADSADYFSLGMTDELLSRLAQIEDLSVIARTSVMQYRGTEKTIPEIARELGVAHVVEGSVRKAGGKVRIQAQLIDARTGKHLWAEGFTRPFQDVLDLQVDLARTIAGELKATLMPETRRQMAGAARVDSVAYALYLQGRKLRFQETGKSLGEAVRLLRRSVSIDSTLAPAWATLSTAAWLAPRLGGELPEGINADSLARAAARNALRLAPTSAEAHIAMGLVQVMLNLNFPAAGPHFKRAVELSPGLANAHREYGLYFHRMGQFEVGARYLRKAARLDPASPVVFRDQGVNHLYRGNYERAKRPLKKALALQPVVMFQEGLGAYLWAAYAAQDSAQVARRKFSQEIKDNPVGWRYGKLLGYSLAGRRDSARQMARRLSKSTDVRFFKAVASAYLGQPERAMSLLRQIEYFKKPHYHSVKINPPLKPLWDEPSFQRELEKLGLDEATVQETMKKLDPEPPSRPRDRSSGAPEKAVPP